MRISASLVIAALLMATATCKTTQTPPPETPAGEAAADPAQPGGESPAAAAEGRTAAPSADVVGEVVLSLSTDSMDAVLDRGLSYVRPHLPPAFAAMLRPSMLKEQLFRSMQMPRLEAMIDTTRPMALAVADPEQHRGGGRMGSSMVAVPVHDAQGVADALGQIADQHERTPWGDHRFSFGGQKLHLRFADGHALMASHEKLLNGAAAVLMPLIQKQRSSGKAGQLRIRMDTINRLYGDQIERGLSRMKRRMGRKGPQMAGTARMVTRWIGYIRGIDDILLEAELEPANIRAVGTLTAAASGAFSTYLGQLREGPVWGARYLPDDSALVYIANQSPDSMIQSIDEGVEVLQGMVQGVIPAKTLTELRDLGRHSVKHLSGESAGAAWVNADGSLGACSIAKVRDGADAQAAMTRLLQFLSKELARLFATGLPAEVRRELKGARVDLRIRPRGLRVAGVTGGLAQLDIRWPRLKGDKRKEMQQVRRRLARVLGPRFTIAFATVGDVLALTVGKDHRKQMARIVAITRGGKGSAMEQVVSKLVGNRRIVALLHVPVVAMAEQVMRLVEQMTTVPAQVKTVFQKVLPPPGKSAPVTAVVRAGGPRLMVEVDLSPELIGMITRGVVTGMSTFRGAAPFPPPPRP